MDRPPLHIDKQELFCNRCNRNINKFTGVLLENGEVYCLVCHNWLCGEWDAFGDITENPSITRIQYKSRPLTKKLDFIPQFLKMIERKLKQDLPEEGFEGELIDNAYKIIVRDIQHIINAI